MRRFWRNSKSYKRASFIPELDQNHNNTEVKENRVTEKRELFTDILGIIPMKVYGRWDYMYREKLKPANNEFWIFMESLQLLRIWAADGDELM